MKELLTKSETTQGPDHPNTLKSAVNLAELYRCQGKYDLAEPLMKKFLAKSETEKGPDHSDTLKSAVNLAELYGCQEKYG